MFRFLRFKRKRPRESFYGFLLDKALVNPSVSIEEVLDDYIKKYDLAVCHALNEPQPVTSLRTRLHVLEESLRDHPDCDREADFQQYLAHIRALVQTLDTMPPDIWKSEQRER